MISSISRRTFIRMLVVKLLERTCHHVLATLAYLYTTCHIIIEQLITKMNHITCVVTNRGISLPRDFQNCPGMGKNTIPGLFLEVAFVGLK